VPTRQQKDAASLVGETSIALGPSAARFARDNTFIFGMRRALCEPCVRRSEVLTSTDRHRAGDAARARRGVLCRKVAGVLFCSVFVVVAADVIDCDVARKSEKHGLALDEYTLAGQLQVDIPAENCADYAGAIAASSPHESGGTATSRSAARYAARRESRELVVRHNRETSIATPRDAVAHLLTPSRVQALSATPYRRRNDKTNTGRGQRRFRGHAKIIGNVALRSDAMRTRWNRKARGPRLLLWQSQLCFKSPLL